MANRCCESFGIICTGLAHTHAHKHRDAGWEIYVAESFLPPNQNRTEFPNQTQNATPRSNPSPPAETVRNLIHIFTAVRFLRPRQTLLSSAFSGCRLSLRDLGENQFNSVVSANDRFFKPLFCAFSQRVCKEFRSVTHSDGCVAFYYSVCVCGYLHLPSG